MTYLYRSEHLTEGYAPQLEMNIVRSHAGPAHFAGTDPRGATCDKCHSGWEPRAGRQHPAESSRTSPPARGAMFPATQPLVNTLKGA